MKPLTSSQKPNRDRLVVRLAKAGSSGAQIAREMGVSRERVRQILKSVGMRSPGVSDTYPRQTSGKCQLCSKKHAYKLFHKGFQKKYCDKCRYKGSMITRWGKKKTTAR